MNENSRIILLLETLKTIVDNFDRFAKEKSDDGVSLSFEFGETIYHARQVLERFDQGVFTQRFTIVEEGQPSPAPLGVSVGDSINLGDKVG